jgi:hypothetical protein
MKIAQERRTEKAGCTKKVGKLPVNYRHKMKGSVVLLLKKKFNRYETTDL